MDKRLKILCDAFLHEKREIAEAFAETYYSTQQIDALCANMVVTRATLPDRDRLWDCRDMLTADTDICACWRARSSSTACALP